jgi:hypothetical protein
MPRMRKRWPSDVYHTEATKNKIANTQKKHVEDGEHNLVHQDTCEFCGVTMQYNMIRRWHHEKCKILQYIWEYTSPKLRKRKS